MTEASVQIIERSDNSSKGGAPVLRNPKSGTTEKKAAILPKHPSVLRAFSILNAFNSPTEWVAASELSRRSRIHEATLNRFMPTLVEVGAVVRHENGKYRCAVRKLAPVRTALSQAG